jgi:ribosome-associated heat shock protein Hsp15
MNGAAMRLDKWLWFARFCKSRSLAAKLCEAGKVRVNRGVIEKAAAQVKPGDVLTFPQGAEIRVVKVLALGLRRGPPAEARTLYEDLAPQ